MIDFQEEYASSLSMEVHDNLGQFVAVLKHQLQFFMDEIDTKQYNDEKYNEIISSFDKLAKTISRLSHKISPTSLQKLGLETALEELFDNIMKNTNIIIKYAIENLESFFKDNWNIHVYRIVQEALTNILKHSKAENVTVLSVIKDDELFLSVSDDGQGFDLKNLESDNSRNGMGLAIMKERAKLINGSLEINSMPQKGMYIILRVAKDKSV